MSLRIWLPLNGDIHNQGISDIQPQLMGNGVTWTTGKIGQAVTFPNNCNSCIYMPGLKLQIFSWACWLKVLGEGSGTSQRILSEGRDTGSVGTNIWVSKAGTTLYWSTHKKSGQTTIELNHWYHVALIADGTYIKFYLNGILKSTTAYTEDSDYAQSNDAFVLGKMAYSYTSTGNYFPFNGQLNDVRIYDHCLSVAEVHEIAQGLVLHYKLDNSINLTNNNVNTWTNFSIGQYYTTIWEMSITSFVEATGAKNGDQFTFSIDINAISGQKPLKARVQQYKSNDDRPSVVSTKVITASSSGRSSVTFALNTDYTKLQLLITNHDTSITTTTTEQWKCIKLEWGNKATPWCQTYNNNIIEDSSGYNHNGVMINDVGTSSDTPRYNNCIHFSSKDQKIFINNFPTAGFGNSYTFAWWAKINDYSPMHWGFSNGTRLNGMYQGNLWNTGDSTDNPLYQPGTTTQVTRTSYSVWHHWAMTGDGTKCRVFLDGALWGEAKTYKAISGSQIYINGWNATTSYSSNNYSISDFRIYCTALSAEDIKELYQVSASIDKLNNIYSFEEIENNNIFKIFKNGQLEHGLLIENRINLNNINGWSYSPTGANNSCEASSIVVDFSPFVGLNKAITLQIEGDLSWSDIVPNGNGTFKARFQGSNRQLDGTWIWAGTNYAHPDTNQTTAMLANSSGSIHFNIQKTIPATWFNTYNASHVSYRTDYATGTIILSNLKVTLLSDTIKLNNKYITAKQFIEK